MPGALWGIGSANRNRRAFWPMLVPGMVERCQPADDWFDRGYVGAFPRVAAKARESQIGFDRKPAVFPADDVIDLMRGEGVVLAQEAILATIEGAPRHQAAEGVADVTWQDRYAGGREPRSEEHTSELQSLRHL